MSFDFLEHLLTDIFTKMQEKKAQNCYELIRRISESNDPKEIDKLFHKLVDNHFLLYSIAEQVFDRRRELCIEKVNPIITKINESNDIDEIRNLYYEANYWASWSITSELSDLINNTLKNKINSIINQISISDDINEISLLYSGVTQLIECLPKFVSLELQTHMYDVSLNKVNNLLSRLRESKNSEEIITLYQKAKLILYYIKGTYAEKSLSQSLSHNIVDKKTLAMNTLKSSNSLEEIDSSFKFLRHRYLSLTEEEKHIIIDILTSKIDLIINEIRNNDTPGIYRTEETLMFMGVILPEDKKSELNSALTDKAEEIIQRLHDSTEREERNELYFRATFMDYTISNHSDSGIHKRLEEAMIEKINFIMNQVKENDNSEEIAIMIEDLKYLVNLLPVFTMIKKAEIERKLLELIENYKILSEKPKILEKK